MPILETLKEEDISTTTADGLILRGRHWLPEGGGETRGVVLISHGLGEHVGCYREAVESLRAFAPMEAIGFDFRGHGRSPGRRGVVRRYDDLVQDLRAGLEFVRRERPGKPVAILGHSNGGLVALLTVLNEPGGPIRALILSNPVLRLAVRVPKWKKALGRFLRIAAPGVTLSAKLPSDYLTRDLSTAPERARDPLRHSRTSPNLFFGMIENGERVFERAEEIQIPTFLILGGSDPIIDSEAGRSFFEKLGAEDKTLLLSPEDRHEPLNDVDRGPILADAARWLAERWN